MPSVEDMDFDVIIVGGRPAGASLASRLGTAGLRVLVLDRSTFPSQPAVSASFVLPHTLAMLDELGLDESTYADDTPKLQSIVLEFGAHFRAFFRFPEPISGRTHFYGIDRARLDHAMWRSLERHSTVTAIEGASVIDLLTQDDRVAGVVARLPGREGLVGLRAGCVVGAGGRYDLVARKVKAAVIHERRDVDTAIYYASWDHVADYDDDGGRSIAHIHTSGDGSSFVLMPTSDGRTTAITQTQTQMHAAASGTPQEIYDAALRTHAPVWRRLARATQVSKLSGYKRIGNLFRQPFGPGWALVGDAFHQKDSLDAQGIYDALLSSRLLADALVAWRSGERGWDDALEDYAAQAQSQLRPMFDSTMARVKREIYGSPPSFIVKTVMRWILTHERYGQRFAAVLTRRHDPRELMAPSILIPAMAGGAWRRLLTRVGSRPDPTDPLRVA